jgi:hypothetical protein
VSEMKIRRRSKVFPVTIATSVDHASTVRLDDLAGALVHLTSPPPSAATALTVWVAAEPAGPWYAWSGAAVTLGRVTDGTSFTGVSAAYALPLGVHSNTRLSSTPAAFVRLVSDVDLGSATAALVCGKS